MIATCENIWDSRSTLRKHSSPKGVSEYFLRDSVMFKITRNNSAHKTINFQPLDTITSR
jgi:hypothetical protein